MSNEVTDGPSGSVTVQFKLTQDEAIPVFRWQLRQTYFSRPIIFGIAMIAVVGIVFLFIPGIPRLLGAVVLFLAVIEVALLVWLYASVPGRAWRKLDSAGDQTILVFTDDGVGVVTKNTTAQNRWAVYSETVQRPGMYLLKVGKRRAYQPVPRRSFLNPGDEEVFRSLATRHTDARLQPVESF